jgi:ribosomal protein L37AE/L43A
MKKDYTRVCWNCGNQDLETDSRGILCRKCGATWNKVPELHHTSEPGFAMDAPEILASPTTTMHPQAY